MVLRWWCYSGCCFGAKTQHVGADLPAKGTLNGSVQNTWALCSAISAVLTARAVCIGSSGGTTEVRIKTHLRREKRKHRKKWKARASAECRGVHCVFAGFTYFSASS